MIYQKWKQLYIAVLKNKINSHKYSENHSEQYLDELSLELLERGGFEEGCGHWDCVTAEQAAEESFQLWLDDYFIDEEQNNE